MKKDMTPSAGEYKGLLFQVSAMEKKIKMLEAIAEAAEEYAHQMEGQNKLLIAQLRGAE